jgi:hypothetical protein
MIIVSLAFLETFWPHKERTHKKAIIGQFFFNFILKRIDNLFFINIILITIIFK